MEPKRDPIAAPPPDGRRGVDPGEVLRAMTAGGAPQDWTEFAPLPSDPRAFFPVRRPFWVTLLKARDGTLLAQLTAGETSPAGTSWGPTPPPPPVGPRPGTMGLNGVQGGGPTAPPARRTGVPAGGRARWPPALPSIINEQFRRGAIDAATYRTLQPAAIRRNPDAEASPRPPSLPSPPVPRSTRTGVRPIAVGAAAGGAVFGLLAVLAFVAMGGVTSQEPEVVFGADSSVSAQVAAPTPAPSPLRETTFQKALQTTRQLIDAAQAVAGSEGVLSTLAEAAPPG